MEPFVCALCLLATPRGHSQLRGGVKRPRGSPSSLLLPLCCLALCLLLWMLWFPCCPEAELGPSHPDTVETGVGRSRLLQMGRGYPEMRSGCMKMFSPWEWGLPDLNGLDIKHAVLGRERKLKT